MREAPTKHARSWNSNANATGLGGCPAPSGRLPRGRHGIPNELIAANQRERLLNATASAIAESGYASLAVSDLTERAGVSRATFYQLFDDKHHCVIEAQAWAIDRLWQAVSAAGEQAAARGGEWPLVVAAGVGAALDFAAAFPGEARLVLASSNSPSEPKLAREGLVLHLQLVRLLHEGAERFAGAPLPGGLTEQAAVGAAMAIAGNCLAAGRPDALQDLRGDLVQIVLMPYLGLAEAGRVAAGR
jgi:AcrR family transcriptional regulator